MKKWTFGYGLLLLAVAAAAVFGIVKRGSYTDITNQGQFMDQLYVAELPGKLAANECRQLKRALPGPYILCVEAQGDMEYTGYPGSQKVRVRKVWKGEGIQEGQEIALFADSWALVLREEPASAELGFTNKMKAGREYLVFAVQKAVDADTGCSAYRLYKEGVILPIFCYGPCVDKIVPTNGEHTYVPYKEVKGNEFFAADKKGLRAWKTLKSYLLEQYPANILQSPQKPAR